MEEKMESKMNLWWHIPIVIVVFSIVRHIITSPFEPKTLPIVEGYFQPEFMEAALVLRKNMEAKVEIGASFSVYHEGVPIIDMWAGYADIEAKRRWRNETTTLMFGCTKAVVAFLVAVLVDKGRMKYDAPISEYWPEVRANDKEKLTLENLLSQQAGIAHLDEAISLRDLRTDIQKVERILVEQKPLYEPGSQQIFHDIIHGLYLDRIIQRVDGKGRLMDDIVQQELAQPLQIELNLRTPKDMTYKTARLFPPSTWDSFLQTVTSVRYLKIFFNKYFTSEPLSSIPRIFQSITELYDSLALMNDPELREETISSFTGTGTARGLAKLYGIIANEGMFEGVQVIKKETIAKMLHPMTWGICPFSGLEARFGRGVQIFKNPYGEDVYGHAGYGGQVVIADPINNIAIAYLTSYLSIYELADDPRFLDLQAAVYKNLEKYINRKRRTQYKLNG